MSSENTHGKLVIFSAPSGAGKSSIVQCLLGSELPLVFSISATTREPRGQEQDGREYYFLNEEEFRQKIDMGAFAEYFEVYPGLMYGTLKSELERIWGSKNHVVFDVDVVGGKNLKQQYGDRALLIFVQPPSLQELEQRLRKRGTESPGKIGVRIKRAGEEMKMAADFDEIILNDDLEKACRKAYRIVSGFLEKEE